MSKQKTDDSLIESHTAAIGGYKVNFSNPSGMDIDIPNHLQGFQPTRRQAKTS